MPVLRDWYLKVLDAHVVFENDFLSFITFDDEHHRLAIAQLPLATPRTAMTVGLAHSAYTFGDLGSLLEKYLDLKEAGIEPRAQGAAWPHDVDLLPRPRWQHGGTADRQCATGGSDGLHAR